MLTPTQIALCMFAALAAAFVALPRKFNRKMLHIITGYTFINYFSKSAECARWIAVLPFFAVVLYSVSLCCSKLHFIPRALGKSGRFSPFGILVYGILMTILPFTRCDQRFSRALICVSAGDGCAGLLQFSYKFGLRLPWNKKKTFFGFSCCYVGSLVGIYLFDHYIDYFLPLIASMAESVDLEDDNLVVFLAAYLGELVYVPAVVCVLVLHLAVWAFRRKMLTLAACVVGMIESVLICIASPIQTLGLITFACLGFFSSNFSKQYSKKHGFLTVAKHYEKEFVQGRGVESVLANSFPYFICAIATLIFPYKYQELTLCSLTASVECLADTFGSDFGAILAKTARHPLILHRTVQKGINGGVSLVGTLCGVAGAFFVSHLAIFVVPTYRSVLTVMISALIGFYADSIIGILFYYSGKLQNGQIVNKPCAEACSVGGMDLLSNGAVNCISSALSGVICAIALIN